MCVAGIDLATGRWIRLYPLPFRDLPKERKFSKYATIEVQTRKSKSDVRPESHNPNVDSLEVVSAPLPGGTWKKRSDLVLPLVRSSMCEVVRRQQESGESLGLFKPAEPPELEIVEREEKDWSAEKRMVIAQGRLLAPDRTPLEFIPYRFLYRYRCSDEPGCKGHRQTIVDWEISEAYRDWRRKYGAAAVLDHVREKWTATMWGEGRDSYIYTGNQLARPAGFLVLGVYWPPRSETATGG